MALFRGPRFSHVVIGAALGVVACGVAVSLAGPTPWPPAEPIDGLPDGVENVREFDCSTDLASAVASLSSTTVESVGPPVAQACWRLAVVTAEGETSNQLADRLAQHFTAEGFVFRGQTAGPERSYLARQPACGTILAIDTGTQAIGAPPGVRALAAPPAGPGTPQPGLPDPAGGGPAATDGSGNPVEGAPDPATDPGSGQDQAMVEPDEPIDPSTGGMSLREALSTVGTAGVGSVQNYFLGNARPGAVIVATQQSFSVKPPEAGSAC